MIPPKILVIEDDPQLQDMYKRKLTFEHYNALVATTGAEGMAMAKKELPDVILLDIMLPGNMNGFDVLESLKRDPEVMHIPVIIATNITTEEIVGKNIGAADYLVKSNTSLDEVIAKIQKQLELKNKPNT